MMLIIVIVAIIIPRRIVIVLNMVLTVVLTMVPRSMEPRLGVTFLHVLDGAVSAQVKDYGTNVPMVTVVSMMRLVSTMVVLHMMLYVTPLAIITEQIEDISHLSLLHGRCTIGV